MAPVSTVYCVVEVHIKYFSSSLFQLRFFCLHVREDVM
jgi:hypothetical protein